ncbi:Serine/threonine protein phosphatase [Marinobacterium lacunae]|uniref:Serine/threonine protein phosphatase n=1 Tax=Marinobacterium lacunae TaxID=1232683 RepID=A0A081G2M1_9GAMM|nr:metallophosphoesterase [Marinobacterium lacunae]KEA65026.1 Serine/threonine protein phosphatase [Marinobacterium lacunae]
MNYPILNVGANTLGRDFVVGDIHGWLGPLEAELEAVCFDRAVDRLFSVGDIINRGPDSEACLMLTQEPWFFAVRGNHEQILFNWLEDPESINTGDWMKYGGKAWLGEGPEHYFWRHPEVRAYAEKLSREMPWAIELALPDGRTLGISHSTVPVNDWLDLKLRLASDKALREELIWARPVNDSAFTHWVDGVDLTVHGHVILPCVQKRGNGIYIDTGAALFGARMGERSDIPHPRITAIEVHELFEIPDDYIVP